MGPGPSAGGLCENCTLASRQAWVPAAKQALVSAAKRALVPSSQDRLITSGSTWHVLYCCPTDAISCMVRCFWRPRPIKHEHLPVPRGVAGIQTAWRPAASQHGPQQKPTSAACWPTGSVHPPTLPYSWQPCHAVPQLLPVVSDTAGIADWDWGATEAGTEDSAPAAAAGGPTGL